MTASNLPKISNRAKKALDVLANGGRFIERLERNSYTGRNQFQIRLMAQRVTGLVSGVGRAAFYELKEAGMLQMTDEGTSASTYYKLRVD